MNQITSIGPLSSQPEFTIRRGNLPYILVYQRQINIFHAMMMCIKVETTEKYKVVNFQPLEYQEQELLLRLLFN